MYNIICKNCGKEHTAKGKHAKFCCERCRTTYNRKNRGTKQTCIWCNDVFNSYKIKRYCSLRCRREHQEQKKLLNRLIKALDTNKHKQCAWCGSYFYAKQNRSKCCSDECNYQLHYSQYYKPKLHHHKCRECGKHYSDHQSNSAGCSDECKNTYSNRMNELNRRSKLKQNGRIDWDISLEKVIKRDKGICHLCNERVKMNEHYNNDLYGSIDHVMPISKGGTHTWDNVKLAHRCCNTLKSNSVGENNEKQLVLL